MKIAVSILGLDCPGVVHLVSSTLSGLGCHIDEISQTILLGQFAAIFIADAPSISEEQAHSALVKAIAARDMSLSVIVRPLDENALYHGGPSEPFVITVDGEDRMDMVSSFTRILAEHRINIENMKALVPENGETSGSERAPEPNGAKAGPRRALLVFEVALPLSLDRSAFRRTLEDRARAMGLRVSMQHRDIFEALHRVDSV